MVSTPKTLLRKLACKEIQAAATDLRIDPNILPRGSLNRASWYRLLSKYSKDKRQFPFKIGPELYGALFDITTDEEYEHQQQQEEERRGGQ